MLYWVFSFPNFFLPLWTQRLIKFQIECVGIEWWRNSILCHKMRARCFTTGPLQMWPNTPLSSNKINKSIESSIQFRMGMHEHEHVCAPLTYRQIPFLYCQCIVVGQLIDNELVCVYYLVAKSSWNWLSVCWLYAQRARTRKHTKISAHHWGM